MKGAITISVLALLAAAGILGPMALDNAAGDRILPDSALHGIERAGEAVGIAIGTVDRADVADERLEEYRQLIEKPQPIDPVVLNATRTNIDVYVADLPPEAQAAIENKCRTVCPQCSC